MGVRRTYNGFSSTPSFNYDHWLGLSDTQWNREKTYSTNPSYQYFGQYGRDDRGKDIIWLIRLQLPSFIEGQAVQKITSISLTVYGQKMTDNNFFSEACIIGLDSFPTGNDTPKGWLELSGRQSAEKKTAGQVDTQHDTQSVTYSFKNLSLDGGKIYYIVFFSSSGLFKYDFITARYPSLTIGADVLTHGIRYHWFDNKFNGNTWEVSLGQQKLDTHGFEQTLINDYHCMVYGWCTTPADLETAKKRNMSGQKYYFEGNYYSIQNGLDLYPVGGMVLNLGLEKHDILKNYYLLNNAQYALEVPREKKVGNSDSFGVGFWIDKPDVGEKSIPYVMQNGGWHMLGGRLRSRIDSGDDSYKLGRPGVKQAYYYHFVGRGTGAVQELYSKDLTCYKVPVTFIGDAAYNLFKTDAEYSWEELRDSDEGLKEFRDATITGSQELWKAMPSASSLLKAGCAVELTFPVYKINVKTFDWALTEYALYGQVNGIMKRWLVSSSEKTIGECFTPKGRSLLRGIVNENELKNSSTLQGSYDEKEFLNELNACGSSFTNVEGTPFSLPMNTKLFEIPVSKWQQLNSGGNCDFNQFPSTSLPPSNEYGVVLNISSFSSKLNIVLYFKKGYELTNSKIIGGNEVKVPLRVYWVNQTPYIFYKSDENWLEISNSDYDKVATLLQGFTGWVFNGRSYMSLKDLFIQEAETLCDNYTKGDKSVIELKVGDTNGFAYIKELDGKIGQYYIYVKDNDSDTSLTRCTPYIKQGENNSWLYKSYHNILQIDAPGIENK